MGKVQQMIITTNETHRRVGAQTFMVHSFSLQKEAS